MANILLQALTFVRLLYLLPKCLVIIHSLGKQIHKLLFDLNRTQCLFVYGWLLNSIMGGYSIISLQYQFPLNILHP